ncbi:MAG: hypothetical protein CMJ54_11780 [Planctomycetaceae bacterium]|nr:hypothetical protein [Planctomycetaceae bacterium]
MVIEKKRCRSVGIVTSTSLALVLVAACTEPTVADDDMVRREAIFDDGIVSTLPPVEIDHGVDIWDEARGREIAADEPRFDRPRNGLNAGPWRHQCDSMSVASVVLTGRSRDGGESRVAIYDRGRTELTIWKGGGFEGEPSHRLSHRREIDGQFVTDAFQGTTFERPDRTYRIASGAMLPGCMLFLLQRSDRIEEDSKDGAVSWRIAGVTVAAMQEDSNGEWTWTHVMDMPPPDDPDAHLFQRGYASSMSAFYPTSRDGDLLEAFVPLVDYMNHQATRKATGGQCGLFRVRRSSVDAPWELGPLYEVHSSWRSDNEHFHVAGWTPNGVTISIGDATKSRLVLAQCSDWEDYDDPANWTVIPRWQGQLEDGVSQVTTNQFWSCCPGNHVNSLICGGDNVSSAVLDLEVPESGEQLPEFREMLGYQPSILASGNAGNTVSWLHRSTPQTNGPMVARQTFEWSGNDSYSRILYSATGESFATVARLPEDFEQYAIPFLVDGEVCVHRFRALGQSGIFKAAVPSEDRTQAGLLAMPGGVDLLRDDTGAHRPPDDLQIGNGVSVVRVEPSEVPGGFGDGLAPDSVCYRVTGIPTGTTRLLAARVDDPHPPPANATSSTAVHLQVCNLLSGKLRLQTRVWRGGFSFERTHNIVSTGDWNDIDVWSPALIATRTSTIAVYNPIDPDFASVDFLLVIRSLTDRTGKPNWVREAITDGKVPSTRVSQPLGIRGGEWRVGAELQLPPDGLDYSIGTRVESMPLCTFEFGAGRYLRLRSGINNGSVLIESIVGANHWFVGQMEDLDLNRGDTINIDLRRQGGRMSISVVAAGSLGETPATVVLPIIHETPPTRFMLGDENHELVSSLILRRVYVDTPRRPIPGIIAPSEGAVRADGPAGSTAMPGDPPKIRHEDLVFEIMRGIGSKADRRFDPRDVDGDGSITFLDVRRLLAPSVVRDRVGPPRR